jgi:anti-sigma-K factor RskA
MNLVELQKKLIAAARANAPSGSVPYAFEKRITALLNSSAVAQKLDLWVHGLWRAAVSCAAIALVCGAFALFVPATNDANGDLSQNLTNTLLASVDQSDQAP